MATNCCCNVCKISQFGHFISPPSLPNYRIPIKSTTSCSSGPAVVYHLTCKSGRPDCDKAHYTGMASSTTNKKPMALRWANHKSHHKKKLPNCEMTKHLIMCHPNEDPQDLIKLVILEECPNKEIAKVKESEWAFRLFSYYPSGLNQREEGKHYQITNN